MSEFEAFFYGALYAFVFLGAVYVWLDWRNLKEKIGL